MKGKGSGRAGWGAPPPGGAAAIAEPALRPLSLPLGSWPELSAAQLPAAAGVSGGDAEKDGAESHLRAELPITGQSS